MNKIQHIFFFLLFDNRQCSYWSCQLHRSDKGLIFHCYCTALHWIALKYWGRMATPTSLRKVCRYLLPNLFNEINERKNVYIYIHHRAYLSVFKLLLPCYVLKHTPTALCGGDYILSSTHRIS